MFRLLLLSLSRGAWILDCSFCTRLCRAHPHTHTHCCIPQSDDEVPFFRELVGETKGLPRRVRALLKGGHCIFSRIMCMWILLLAAQSKGKCFVHWSSGKHLQEPYLLQMSYLPLRHNYPTSSHAIPSIHLILHLQMQRSCKCRAGQQKHTLVPFEIKVHSCVNSR